MLIKITESAEQGLLSIADYLVENDAAEAERIVCAIIDAAYSLRQLPKRGRPGRVTGTLELLVPGLPYLLVYTAMPDEVRIVQILHQRQKWP